MAELADEITNILRRIARHDNRPVPLYEPRLAGQEWAYVKECLDTGWVSYAGSYVTKFESMLKEVTGAGDCAVVVNGTVAIEMALRVVGVKPGDEVLSPSLTFVATNNAIAHIGATPHFCDSASNTLGLDPVKLATYLTEIGERRDDGTYNRRTGRRLAALMPMHCFGHPVDMDPLLDLAKEWAIPVIEDATESLGSRYKDRPTGNLATIGTLSFNGNKIVTTGGGGAILTRDPDLARRIRHLTTTAKQPHAWEFNHDEVGWNYRLPNVNAAIGCAQLEQLAGNLASKRALAQRYQQAFGQLEGARIFEDAPFATSNYWLVTLLLDRPDIELRNQVLTATHAAGFLCRPAWRLNHQLPMFKDCPRMDLSVAENLQARIINLPSSPGLQGI
jgi:perosamine synthetase